MVSDIVSLLSGRHRYQRCGERFCFRYWRVHRLFTDCSTDHGVRTVHVFFWSPVVRPGSVASAVDTQLFEERIVVRLSSEEVMEESHPVLGSVRLEDRSPIGHANR